MEQPTDQSERAQVISSIAVMLYICLVLATLLISVYLWSTKTIQVPSSKAGPTLQAYTDSTGRFTLRYPATWRLAYGQYSGEGPTPDWSKESRPIKITPPDAPDPSAGIFIEPFTAKMADDMISSVNDSSFYTVKLTVIGGKAAYYDKLNFIGPSGAERYTDSNYLIPDGDHSLWITFRENYYHNYPHESWSNGDISALTSVVSSIEFLEQ